MPPRDFWTRWLPKEPKSAQKADEQEQGKALLSGSVGRSLALLALVGATLMILSRGGPGPEKPVMGSLQQPKQADAIAPSVSPEERLARELKEILWHMEGVGEVEVYVTLQAGSELVVAEEVTLQRTTGGEQSAAASSDLRESRRPVTLRDEGARSEKPLVVLEKKPTVKGVVVVAQGATSPRVRYDLMQAVQTALAVPANRVAVFAMRP